MNEEKFFEDFNALGTPVKIKGKLKDWHDKVECDCLLCKEEFLMTPSNLKRGSVHKKCSRMYNRSKVDQTNVFKDKLAKVNDSLEVTGIYTKAKESIEVKCKICGHIWAPTANSLLNGHGCPKCYYASVSNRRKITNIDDRYALVSDRFENLIFVSKSDKVYGETLCKCNKCNNTWKTTLHYLETITSDNCCPYCTFRLVDKNKFIDFFNKERIKCDYIPDTMSEKINCECLVCGYKWSRNTAYLLHDLKGCPICNDLYEKSHIHSSNPRKTHEEFINEVNIKNPNVEILSKYINAKTKVLRKCKICGHICYMLPADIMNGVCAGCASIKMHDKFAKTQEEFSLGFNEKYGSDYLIIGTYKNIDSYISIKHLLCNNIFEFKPANMYNHAIHICPYCYPKNSNGERAIENFFYNNEIPFDLHKTFKDLRGVNNGLLSYDFYLENYNLLIEFQGIQHYKPVDKFGGEKQFKIQLEHDKRKREYACNHNIELLKIPYFDIDNIDSILSKKLCA